MDGGMRETWTEILERERERGKEREREREAKEALAYLIILCFNILG